MYILCSIYKEQVQYRLKLQIRAAIFVVVYCILKIIQCTHTHAQAVCIHTWHAHVCTHIHTNPTHAHMLIRTPLLPVQQFPCPLNTEGSPADTYSVMNCITQTVRHIISTIFVYSKVYLIYLAMYVWWVYLKLYSATCIRIHWSTTNGHQITSRHLQQQDNLLQYSSRVTSHVHAWHAWSALEWPVWMQQGYSNAPR